MAAEEKENPTGDETAEDDELTEGLQPKKFSGRKIIMIVAGVLLLSALGTGGYFFFAGGDDEHLAVADAEATAAAASVVFFDLPEMLISINNNGRVGYLKVQVSLELDEEAGLSRLEQMLPRVVDNFQVYLRELRAEDIDGSAGMFRLKEELLRRVNMAVAPTLVNDVLFRELLIQ